MGVASLPAFAVCCESEDRRRELDSLNTSRDQALGRKRAKVDMELATPVSPITRLFDVRQKLALQIFCGERQLSATGARK